MARAREVPGFDCEEPFAAAAARVVRVRAGEVFEHSEGVLDIDEIDHLHDMRVATRRLRAALEVFGDCFPRKRFRKALKKVKALADALGERRDRDVEIEFLSEFAEAAPEAERPAVAARIKSLREEQRQANEDLAPYLEEKRLGKLRRRLEKLVEEVER
ncbi:MAG TPA: CHAD domain-containing protein [Solirubrobacterales bacterium]|nr:CHAD domain-containing protein [Solirubrobacterales bacterium]